MHHDQPKARVHCQRPEAACVGAHETVLHACQCMRERHAGSGLVIDDQQRLKGIFTGRDAVRTLAEAWMLR